MSYLLSVAKFGGSSLATSEIVSKVRNIITDDNRRKIAVVSAPGRKNKSDKKVTDMLIELAGNKDSKLINEILGRYEDIYPGQDIDEIRNILLERVKKDLPFPAYLDSLKAFGEEAQARLLARIMDAVYIDPSEILVVTNDFGNAVILEDSKRKIKDRISLDRLVVIPGFYGYSANGELVTFSRGGSDLTGAYVASCFDNVIYENFTDTNGVFAADPKLVDNPAKIDEITYEELRDLAYSGFTVFHAEAMKPVKNAKIPVHIRNTFTYPSEGTYVVNDREADKPIVGIAYKNGFCSFNVEMTGLNDSKGILNRITSFFSSRNKSIEHIITGIDDVTVVAMRDEFSDAEIDEVKTDLYGLGENATVVCKDNVGCLVVAGKGLRGHIGISGEIQRSLAFNGVNIEFITQGSLERCIIYGIEHRDNMKAVNAVYNRFFKG